MEAFTPDFRVGVEYYQRGMSTLQPHLCLPYRISVLQCSGLVLMHETGCSIHIWQMTRSQLCNMVTDLDSQVVARHHRCKVLEHRYIIWTS